MWFLSVYSKYGIINTELYNIIQTVGQPKIYDRSRVSTGGWFYVSRLTKRKSPVQKFKVVEF